MTGSANIAAHLPEMARRAPNEWALITNQWGDRFTHTFAQLDDQTNCLARGFSEIGLERGMRVALMVPPGSNFFNITFALFKLGAIPVLIDPGMGIWVRVKIGNRIEKNEPIFEIAYRQKVSPQPSTSDS